MGARRALDEIAASRILWGEHRCRPGPGGGANPGPEVFAVVSRGGRPDMTGSVITDVRSPTLLIVGERDTTVLGLNRRAYAQLRVVDKELAVVPGATHLFEEPGAIEEVTRLAAEWFVRHLP